jgi:hypothetical protein
VRARNIAPNSVVNRKVKKHSLTPSRFRRGTLPGLSVANLQVSSIGGVDAPASDGAGTVVGGPVSFVPKAGKSYLLEEELRGKVSDAPTERGAGPARRVWTSG